MFYEHLKNEKILNSQSLGKVYFNDEKPPGFMYVKEEKGELYVPE